MRDVSLHPAFAGVSFAGTQIKLKEDEAGLSLSKLVSKLEAGIPRLEFPGRASTTLNVRLTKVKWKRSNDG